MANLRLRSDIIDEVLIRLSASTTLGYYTDTILNNWETQSHQWAAGFRKWPFTEARVSTTYASLVTDEDGLLRGEYPEGFKADSIRYLTIGGKKLDKKNIFKFRQFIEDNPDDDEKIYSDFGRNYYINPKVDLSGTIMVWGQYTPAADITDENELTVFSGYEPDGNEAIVLEMLSYSMLREKKTQESIAYHKKATELLDIIWKRVTDEQFAYQSTDDDGMFKRIDVLGGALREDTLKRDQWY